MSQFNDRMNQMLSLVNLTHIDKASHKEDEEKEHIARPSSAVSKRLSINTNSGNDTRAIDTRAIDSSAIGTEEDRIPSVKSVKWMSSEERIKYTNNHLNSCNFVYFNLNGKRFKFSESTLSKLDHSIFEHSNITFNEELGQDEYFFSRNSYCFSSIIDYLQNGHLHMPNSICPVAFEKELMFWGISPQVMDICCLRKFQEYKSQEKRLDHFVKSFNKGNEVKDPKKANGWERLRRKVWLALDHPETSFKAKLYFTLKCFIVLLFIFESMALTHKYFSYPVIEEKLMEHMQDYEDSYRNLCDDTQKFKSQKPSSQITAICEFYRQKFLKSTKTEKRKRYIAEFLMKDLEFGLKYNESYHNNTHHTFRKEQQIDNETIQPFNKIKEIYSNFNNKFQSSPNTRFVRRQITGGKIVKDVNQSYYSKRNVTSVYTPDERLYTIELFLTGYFIVEYLIELIFSPSKLHHVFTFYSFVDLLSIVSSVFGVLINYNILVPEEKYAQSSTGFLNALGSLKLLRVFVVLKRIRGFRLMAFAIRFSYKDLLCFLVNIGVVVIIMSFFVYHVERENDNFSSIPHAMWWAVVTLTTVGYGDVVPTTALGKTLGVVTCLTSLLCTAMLVPLFMNDFMIFNKVAKISDEKKQRTILKLLNPNWSKGGTTTKTDATNAKTTWKKKKCCVK